MSDEDDTIQLDKQHRPRRARAEDARTDQELWHVLHDHDAEFAALKREFSELKRSFFEMKVTLATVSKTIDDLSAKFDSKLREQFLAHEKREMETQMAQADRHFKGLVRVLLIVLSVLGAVGYFILNKLVLAAAGGM